jgi:tRNA A37 methylthiotransferase MiaB
LSQFLGAADLDAVGVFGYSDEDGTEGAELPDHLDSDEIAERVSRIGILADTLAADRAQRRVGTRTQLLVESVDDDGVVGHSGFQGPDDGETVVTGAGVAVGQLVDVEITDAVGVDLIARVL